MNNNKAIVHRYNVDGIEIEYVVEKTFHGGASAHPQLCGKRVVVKKVDIDAYNGLFKLESEILSSILHRNILRIFHTWHDESKREIIMELEYCPGGSLRHLIRTQEAYGAHFQKEQVRDWLAQMSVAVAYLHNEKGIIHRDIKPDNFLLTADLKTIKLADFGISQMTAVEGPFASAAGTIAYMAPEAGAETESLRNDPKLDVWSLGIVAYELATFKVPYSPCYQPEQVRAPINVAHFSTGLQDLIDNFLLVADHRKRATMTTVLKHGYFADQVVDFQFANTSFLKQKMESRPSDASLVSVLEYRRSQNELNHTRANMHGLEQKLALEKQENARLSTIAAAEQRRAALEEQKYKTSQSTHAETTKRWIRQVAALQKDLADTRELASLQMAKAAETERQLRERIAQLEKKLNDRDSRCRKLENENEELANSLNEVHGRLRISEKVAGQQLNELRQEALMWRNRAERNLPESLLQYGPLFTFRAVAPLPDVGILWDAIYRRGIRGQARNQLASRLLIIATRNNSEEAVRCLVYDLLEGARDSEPLVIDQTKKNKALREAVMLGHSGIVELLMKKGADPATNKSPKSGANCLMLAAASGSRRTFDLIYERCGKISGIVRETDLAGNSILMAAAMNPLGEDCVSIGHFLLKADPQLLNVVNKRGETVLLTAAMCNNAQFIRFLINGPLKMTWPSVKDTLDRTALMAAANTGRAVDAVRVFLEEGADFSNNVVSKDGWTILMVAAISGSAETVRLLLDYGADFSDVPRNSSGWTVLMCAAYGCSVESVRLLVDRGADFSNRTRDRAKGTVLMHAARCGALEIVRFLLQRGADTAAQDEDGDTAVKHALSRGYKEVVDLLQSYAPLTEL